MRLLHFHKDLVLSDTFSPSGWSLVNLTEVFIFFLFSNLWQRSGFTKIPASEIIKIIICMDAVNVGILTFNFSAYLIVDQLQCFD